MQNRNTLLSLILLRTYPNRRMREGPYLSSKVEDGLMTKQAAITDDGFDLSDEF